MTDRGTQGEQPEVNEQHRLGRTDLRASLQAVRRQWLIVLLCGLVAAGAALAYSLHATPLYTASAQLLFKTSSLDSVLFGSSWSKMGDPARDAATNLALVDLPIVNAEAARELNDGTKPGEVAGSVTAAPAGASDVVTVSATDPSAERAAKLANAYAAAFVAIRRAADRGKVGAALRRVQNELATLPAGSRTAAQRTSLQQQVDQLMVLESLQTGNTEVVQRASVPKATSSPKTSRNTALGLILGLLIGVAAAILRWRLDKRIRTPEELAAEFSLPILATVQLSDRIGDFEKLTGAESEAFTMLRTRLRFFNVDREVKLLLVTSSEIGDGKTTVATQVARNAAESGARVALVEADLRSPRLAVRLGLKSGPGLAEIASGSADLASSMQNVIVSEREGRGLDVLVAGAIPPNPAELIQSDTLVEVLTALRDSHDLVIVDSPPMLAVSDTTALLSRVDGAILVGRLGKTHRGACADASRQIKRLEAPVLGLVANGMTKSTTGYGYGYGYGSNADTVPGEAPADKDSLKD